MVLNQTNGQVAFSIIARKDGALLAYMAEPVYLSRRFLLIRVPRGTTTCEVAIPRNNVHPPDLLRIRKWLDRTQKIACANAKEAFK